MARTDDMTTIECNECGDEMGLEREASLNRQVIRCGTCDPVDGVTCHGCGDERDVLPCDCGHAIQDSDGNDLYCLDCEVLLLSVPCRSCGAGRRRALGSEV